MIVSDFFLILQLQEKSGQQRIVAKPKKPKYVERDVFADSYIETVTETLRQIIEFDDNQN